MPELITFDELAERRAAFGRPLVAWRKTAAGALTGFTASEIDEVAAICFAAEQTRMPEAFISVWHAAAMVAGSSCQCLACHRDRTDRAKAAEQKVIAEDIKKPPMSEAELDHKLKSLRAELLPKSRRRR